MSETIVVYCIDENQPLDQEPVPERVSYPVWNWDSAFEEIRLNVISEEIRPRYRQRVHLPGVWKKEGF